MAYFESPALYIDFARLPPPKVIEEINYEALVQIYKDQVLAKRPELARALALEQSPTNVILEAEAYGEMIVRARINAAARAVMLPFATGTDLDNLAAFYNVLRDQIPIPNTDPVEFEAESDARFRRRVQLKPEAFSTAGSVGGYIFHGLSADPTIRDISAMKINDRAGIKISVMNSGSDPTPTPAQIDAVTRRLYAKNIKPLTDVVSVAPANVLRTSIIAEVALYPGPDQGLVLADIQKGLESVRSRVALLGRDLTRSSIIAALNQEGVQRVNLISPAEDIVANLDQCVFITSADVSVLGTRME